MRSSRRPGLRVYCRRSTIADRARVAVMVASVPTATDNSGLSLGRVLLGRRVRRLLRVLARLLRVRLLARLARLTLGRVARLAAAVGVAGAPVAVLLDEPV